MAKNEIQIFRGKMTYNCVKLYANGTKKRFEGFIILEDSNGNPESYKILSFRSQVYIQSETLGERGMAGKIVTAHGSFKENNWQGKVTHELVCEKIYIEGMDELAADAEASSLSLPAVPPGQLPGSPVAPIAPMGAPQPMQMPTAPTMNLPGVQQAAPGQIQNVGPAPIAGAYVAPAEHIQIQPVAPVSNQVPAPVANGPAPIAGAYIAPAAYTVPVQQATAPVAYTAPVQQAAPTVPTMGVAPVQTAQVAPPPKPRKPRETKHVPNKPEPTVAILEDYAD